MSAREAVDQTLQACTEKDGFRMKRKMAHFLDIPSNGEHQLRARGGAARYHS